MLFDLYDTLVHKSGVNRFRRTLPGDLGVCAKRWQECFRRLDRAAMSGELPDLAARVAAACRLAGQPRDPELVARVVAARQELLYAGMTLDPQADGVLRGLRSAGIRVAVVTNAAAYSDRVPDLLGLRPMVDAVIASHAVGVLKPDRRIYQAALSMIGAAARDAVFVGDGRDDELAGARRLGIRTVLVDRGLSHTDTARRDADVVCVDLAQARTVLLGQ